jgi:hypothetical protein
MLFYNIVGLEEESSITEVKEISTPEQVEEEK